MHSNEVSFELFFSVFKFHTRLRKRSLTNNKQENTSNFIFHGDDFKKMNKMKTVDQNEYIFI